MAATPPADFTIKSGDLLPSIQASLLSSGSPVDLTSAAGVNFVMRAVDGKSAKVFGPAVIVAPATSGIVRYDWAAGDTDTPGNYLGEWEVFWPAAKPQTFPTLSYHTITVLASLDNA